ncbi:BTAD domain-containing putative transcriptional regulator [Ktedonobacter robiniae]|nr:BTAD domain-containing putative transcriptional regulator [Ktedonobacter robiniae]
MPNLGQEWDSKEKRREKSKQIQRSVIYFGQKKKQSVFLMNDVEGAGVDTMDNERPEKRYSQTEVDVHSLSKARSEEENPLLRVFLFGPFRVEWLTPSQDSHAWESRTSARSLFKLLLCAPGRQATKIQLAGILWPESEEDKARESLRSASKTLGKVLTTITGEKLFDTSQRDRLKLADQSRLWVDVDAFEQYVIQAGQYENPKDAVALWQEAKDLLGGTFLVEDRHQEWVTHTWVKARRQGLLKDRRKMIRSLADAYIEIGQLSAAEDLLSNHLLRFPTDQDALLRLLVLLVQQGCPDEALMYYEKLQRLLSASGKSLSTHITAFVGQLRESLKGGGEYTAQALLHTSTFSFSPIGLSALKKGDELDEQNVNKLRRQLLAQLGRGTAGAFISSIGPWTDGELIERFAKAVQKPSSIEQAFITHLETTTKNNRKRFVLSKNSTEDIHSLYRDASAHLLTLMHLLEETPAMRLQLYSLTGETSQLLGDICFFQGQNEAAYGYYETALASAQQAQNDVLQAVILGRRSFLPLYTGNASLALSFLQQAHSLATSRGSNIIRAWLMVVEAEVHASLRNAHACQKALQQSEHLLRQPETGMATCAFSIEASYAPFNLSRLQGYIGACYLRLGLFQQAESHLQANLKAIPASSLHRKSIAYVDLAQAYGLQGEVEAMSIYATQAIQALEQTQSPRVIQRLYALRQQLQPWHNTSYVKQLDEYFTDVPSFFQQKLM